MTQSSKMTLLPIKKKRQLIIKYENQNFQPQMWPFSVIVDHSTTTDEGSRIGAVHFSY